MRLTKLEMKGFKSFADKQVIHFDNDVIAIMGSNGCGKSNIVDAIRWVLGEQRTKALRLEKMDNIIFNGTKDRKASNMAQVSLTFDNTKNVIPTEFTNVTISRTIYRTGESDYQINGVSCRLKDIKNLFLDTGIGSSTYAIMELKMIDDVLNDVDNSRRSLIEQAAGISKYKTRKRETLLKLNGTEADLDRVQDLLFEIDGNLKALESQARKANRYKKIKEEYKELSIDLAKYDMLSINDQYEKNEKQLNEFNDQKLQFESTLKLKEASLQKEKTKIIDREKSLSSQQKKLNDFINSIQEKESDKKVAEQKLEFLNDRINTLKNSIFNQSEEEKTLKVELKDLVQKIEVEEKALTNIKSTVTEAKAALEIRRAKSLEIKENLDKQRNEFITVRNQQSEAEKQLAILESKLENLKSNIQRSLFEKEERTEALTKLNASMEKVQKEIEKQQALISSLKEKEVANSESIEKLELLIEEKRNASIDHKRELDAKNNEFRLTKNMIDSLEGFPESIKYLKKNADWLTKTPLLSDLLYCDEKYRVAIEVVLKPYLNHFVVETESEADKAIQLLMDKSKGRAHFFVLEHFKSVKSDATNYKLAKGQISALKIIEGDKKHEALLHFLLKDVIIVEDKEMKEPSADKALCYVNADGQWIKSSLEISGGTVGLFEGKRLGRLKNLEKLEKDIAKLQEKVKKEDAEYKANKEQLIHLKNNSLRRTIDREQGELQKLEREKISYQSRIENFQEFVNQHSKRHEEVEANIKKVEAEMKITVDTLDKANKATNIYRLKLDSLENDFKIASLEFSEMQDKFNEININFIQNENAVQSYKQSRNFKESRLQIIIQDLKKNQEESTNSLKEIERIKEVAIGMNDQLIQLYKERDKRKEELSGEESNYYELKENVQNEEEALRKLSKSKEEIDWNITQCKEKQNNLKFDLQSLKQRLSLEFKIDVEEMLDTLEVPELERGEIELKLNRASNRIENFGEVNPMAETAYDEMKTRFDFITEQKTDLEEAKESLLATIQEIEITAKEHFMDAFVAIRENFKNVFRSMFNEHDNCDLILINPDDPLESNVDIIAKPKGKRPQSINQLSGGEKSLTALSLLFGLYLYKPAPFCILDEVDAPLDLANIDKFNKVIRDFSKDSQFIVVSHQEETGAAADVVHGVTMHKTGISTLVSTDFRNIGEEKSVA
ncbi:MAG: chromosome segregation protein SMC [Chitinophagales bacterium]